MMTRLITGEDIKDGWIVVQDGIYKYWVDYWGGECELRSVPLRVSRDRSLLG